MCRIFRTLRSLQISPDYGPYEYYNIVNGFSKAGFVTISEIREKDTNIAHYSKKVVQWINQLLKAGVLPHRITIVGASKGGMIAANESHRLKNKEIKYVFLASLFRSLVEKDNIMLWGEVLSIYDKSDKFPSSPELFFNTSKGITKSRSIITETGLGHGLIYKPYPVWMTEIITWSGIKKDL